MIISAFHPSFPNITQFGQHSVSPPLGAVGGARPFRRKLSDNAFNIFPPFRAWSPLRCPFQITKGSLNIQALLNHPKPDLYEFVQPISRVGFLQNSHSFYTFYSIQYIYRFGPFYVYILFYENADILKMLIQQCALHLLNLYLFTVGFIGGLCLYNPFFWKS